MAKELTEEQKQSRRNAVKKYSKTHDRINVALPQGTVEKIHALGFSANSFAQKAILEEIEKAEKYLKK